MTFAYAKMVATTSTGLVQVQYYTKTEEHVTIAKL